MELIKEIYLKKFASTVSVLLVGEKNGKEIGIK